ncbi:FAD-dependent oxidoreductase [Candidatus Formimonas warabiya]|uniref:FAD-binding protein n=1 Tax=Formimonas warabiya TaxID=1761012 RepID=A0A3G1KRA4_FORW1|nr:FAD-binding protein [Candidatus Formimonas warabiya]ATW24999.1 hypothetical protein DCMF_09620 [Candidatus Formimonas warabiya]
MKTVENLVNHILETEVLVIGGGSAGCYAAIGASLRGVKVLMVDKGKVGYSGCSPFAAGAINVCLPEDNHEDWFEEIVTRGEYLNDQTWVKIQLDEGWQRVNEIREWGKKYGQKVLEEDANGRIVRRKARGNINTLTAIIHARPMMDTLRKKVIESGVQLLERIMVTHLFKYQGQIVGALGLHCRTAEIYLIKARSVVLAAGGCGFKSLFIGHNNLTGEAQYMAYRAGATLRNLDQAMSNSTSRDADIHGLSLMVGSGGRFLNGQGEEFMFRYDPKVGSRARLTKLVIGMAKEVEAGRGPIYLDLTKVGPDDQQMLRKVLPEGFRAFERMGVDPFGQALEWVPAFEGTLVHGGGIHIDTNCASNVPGLFSAGDTTCTPEHGTWSLTGLNLTFCFVSGYQAGLASAEYSKKAVPIPPGWGELESQITENVAELLAPLRRPLNITSDQIVYHILAVLIPYRVAYLRNETRLCDALNKIITLNREEIPQVSARDPHELVKAFEVRSMGAIAEMILRSVLFRQESRGFVYREDYPLTDNVNWLKWVMLGRNEQGIRVWSESFPTPYFDPPREKYIPR